VGPDVLEPVAHAALVLRPLEDEPERQALVLLRLFGLLDQLLPGLRRPGEAGLLQEVLAVVEETRVGVPGDAEDAVLEPHGLHRAREELVAVREAVGEVCDVAVAGELGGPDDVAPDHVYVAGSGLELGPELVEVLARVGGHLPVTDLEAVALLVEGFDHLRQDARVVGAPGEDDVVPLGATAAAARQRPASKQRRPRKPRPAHLEKLPAAEPSTADRRTSHASSLL